jgi:hypothetical protein
MWAKIAELMVPKKWSDFTQLTEVLFQFAPSLEHAATHTRVLRSCNLNLPDYMAAMIFISLSF